MTTITKERLTKILIETMALIKERSSRTGDSSGISTEVNAELFAEVTRIALASLEAKPVAWMCEDEEGREYNSSNEFSCGRFGVPLYAAPPAPVSVPDGLKQAVEFYEQVKQENIPVETGAWKDAVNWVLDEACRAAMLQGGASNYKTHDKIFRKIFLMATLR